MFTEKKKEDFIIIHDELDAIIKKIVIAKAEYGEHPFKYDTHFWSYDGGIFEIEAEEGYTGGCCDDTPYTRYIDVTWEEIFDVENIVENLKKVKIERDNIIAEKKLQDKAAEKKRNIDAEKAQYERLKLKFEKS